MFIERRAIRDSALQTLTAESMAAQQREVSATVMWLGDIDRPVRELPKDVWGPRGWHWLHTQAIAYPDAPSHEDRLGMSSRFWAFLGTLPCSECRGHAHEYTKKFPPDFTNSTNFQTWAWRFHNAVNRRLGKPILSADQYGNTYREEIDQKRAQYLD